MKKTVWSYLVSFFEILQEIIVIPVTWPFLILMIGSVILAVRFFRKKVLGRWIILFGEQLFAWFVALGLLLSPYDWSWFEIGIILFASCFYGIAMIVSLVLGFFLWEDNAKT